MLSDRGDTLTRSQKGMRSSVAYLPGLSGLIVSAAPRLADQHESLYPRPAEHATRQVAFGEFAIRGVEPVLGIRPQTIACQMFMHHARAIQASLQGE